MDIWFWLFISYIVINFFLLVSMIFFERKKLSSIISWLTILTLLPFLGFLIYIVFGSGLSIRVRRMISRYALYEVEFDREINKYLTTDKELSDLKGDMELVKCCYNYGSVLCPKNDVKLFRNGPDKLEALISDLEKAKRSINIEYYIFADDETGKRVMDVLVKKAKEGVRVRLIYDSIGCLGAPRRFFKRLKAAGGEVAEFFPPFAYIRLINLKLNYRNHRKIVVIDGKIAYTGGINLRNDHMGKKKKVSPWRDAHVRIEGAGVYPLQITFLNDWRYIKKEQKTKAEYVEMGFYARPEVFGDAYLQVITSGPDSPVQYIKETFIKLITTAKKEICIQTPYFIPDESFITALRIAIASGVKVKIMVPNKPDKRTVFWVTLSYLKEMSDIGAEIYFYDGFLHAKTILVDGNKLSIGSCNLDNRSFALNFEDTVLIYSKRIATEYKSYFEDDVQNSVKADQDYFGRSLWTTKFVQAIFRLFSPIL